MATFYCATTGNDTTGTGTAANPYLTVSKLISVLNAGDVGMIFPGRYAQDITITKSGTSAARITLTAQDQANRPTLRGKHWFNGANFWVWDHLNIVGVPNASGGLPPGSTTVADVTPVINGSNIKFSYCDYTNRDPNITVGNPGYIAPGSGSFNIMNNVGSGGGGGGTNVEYDHCLFHEIGDWATRSDTSGGFNNNDHTGFFEHSVYADVSSGLYVHDCTFWRVAGRGLQLYSGNNATWRFENNIVDECGCGVIIDGNANHGSLKKNLFTNMAFFGGVAQGSIYSGSLNTIDDNWFFNNTGGNYNGVTAMTPTNTHTGDPLYTDKPNRNYQLTGTSPALGYGPDTIQPSTTGDIPGATNQTYTLGPNDVGHTISVVVTAHNANGQLAVQSASTGIVVAGLQPAATSPALPPVITGAQPPQVNQTLLATTGSWLNSPTGYSYQWQTATTATGSYTNFGAGSSTSSLLLAPSATFLNKWVRVQVTATNSFGSATQTSVATGPVGVQTVTVGDYQFRALYDANPEFDVSGVRAADNTYNYTLVNVPLGFHSFKVRAIDPSSGSASSYSDVWTWNVGTTAVPPPVVTNGPGGASTGGTTSSTSATFTFTGAAGETFAGAVDNPNPSAFSIISSPAVFAGPYAVGTHTFYLQASDALGQASAVVPYSWTVSTVVTNPPQPSLTPSIPDTQTSSTTKAFSYVGSPAQAGGHVTFLGSQDSRPYVSISGTDVGSITLSGLTLGTHTFSVESVDPSSGAVSVPSTTFTWTVVSQPPAPVFLTTPTASTLSTDAAFTWVDSQSDVTFEASLDGALFTPAVSGGLNSSFSGLGQGSHAYQVRAIDQAGVRSAITTFSWTVAPSGTPIAPTITSATSGGAPLPQNGTSPTTDATFNFVQSNVGAALTYETQTTFSGIATNIPITRTQWIVSPGVLLPGPNFFQVRVRDGATGLASPWARWDWTITATPVAAPVITVHSDGTGATISSGGTTQNTAATFQFSSTTPGATFQGRLDGAPFAAVTSPVTYTGLLPGTHSFQVFAQSPAGLSSTTQFAWNISTSGGGPVIVPTDLLLGRVKLLTAENELSETVGDPLDTSSGVVLPTSRAANAFTTITLPLHGLGADPYSEGDRMRRQLRSLLDNPAAKRSGLYFKWAADPDLNSWVMVGEAEIAYAEGGVTLGDYQLTFRDAYQVASMRTHRPARRVEAYIRSAATTPNDLLKSVYSNDFSSVSGRALRRTMLPVGAIGIVGSGRTTVTFAESIKTLNGTVGVVWNRAHGEVLSFEIDESFLNLADVVIYDRRGSLTPVISQAGDIDPTVYGWEEVYGSNYPFSDDVPVMQNGVVRVSGDANTGTFVLSAYTGGAAGYTEQGRFRVVNSGVEDFTNVIWAGVYRWTAEYATVMLRVMGTSGRACEVYISMQRGWNGVTIEAYQAGTSTLAVRYVPLASGTTLLDTSASSPTAYTNGTIVRALVTTDEPWVSAQPSSGPVVYTAVNRAGALLKATSESSIYGGSRNGFDIVDTGYVFAGIGFDLTGVASGDSWWRGLMWDSRAIPELVGR